jgi:WD40 repeat protein
MLRKFAGDLALSLRRVRAKRGHDGWVSAVAISADSRWLVTGSEDKTARLWDLSAKDPAVNPMVLQGREDRVTAVAISPDSRWVVTGSDDNMARL